MKLHRRLGEAEIPTSSMADVAFLLIIFFLVASFYSVTRGLELHLPPRDNTPAVAQPEDAVLIEITATSALSVDSRALGLGELSGYLRARLERNPGKPVILHTSLEAPYRAMTDVFDELKKANVTHLVIPTSNELELYGLERLD